MKYKIFLESHNINNPYTGFGQFNLHLLKGFFNAKDKSLEFVVHTPKKGWLKKLFGNFFTYKYYAGFRRYPRFQIRKKYDIWHSLNQNTKIEPKNKMPYVLTIHDVNFIEEVSSDINHPRNQLFIEKLNRADAITYISEFAKQSTHSFFKVPHVPEYVIYNGNPIDTLLDTRNFKPPNELTEKFLFSIGDFRDRKNFHLLVEMLPHLPNYQLVIAGNDTRKYAEVVRETIQKLNLEDRVLLVGRVDNVAKQYYFENCDALLFPSLREGFGLPPIEAMKFGKPVFLAKTTSLPEIGGAYAFYFEDFIPENMSHIFVAGMKKFEANRSLYEKELKKQAARFNWNDAAKQYIEVYKKLLHESRD